MPNGYIIGHITVDDPDADQQAACTPAKTRQA